MANIVYDKLKSLLISGDIDLTASDELSVLLVQESNPTIVTSAIYVSATMAEVDADVSVTSAVPLTEVSGTNYTAGGVVLSGTSATDNGTQIFLDAGDITWYNSTITAGGALIYKTAANYINEGIPLIYIDFVADRISSNGVFTLQWTSEGIIEITS